MERNQSALHPKQLDGQAHTRAKNTRRSITLPFPLLPTAQAELSGSQKSREEPQFQQDASANEPVLAGRLVIGRSGSPVGLPLPRRIFQGRNSGRQRPRRDPSTTTQNIAPPSHAF